MKRTPFPRTLPVRAVGLALCLVMLLGLVPVHAAGGETGLPAGNGDAKVVKLSGDYGHGYYVIFQYNGREYRSDIAGSEINYKLWLKCSDGDRKRIAYNFGFAHQVLDDQFGADHAAEIRNWANDPWKKATELLKKRIAAREFPVLAHIYESDLTYYDRAKINETSQCDFKQYLFLPEVRQYQEIENNMREIYDCGQRCYATLKEVKAKQTSIAVKTISSGLIELITDRAMVPAITPGGLSGLMPDVKGELIGLVENLTGLQGELKAMVIGEKPDPNKARQYINYYWRIIDANEKLGNACVNQFISLKSKKQEVYDRADAAIQAWKKQEEAAWKEATEKGEKVNNVSVSPTGGGYSDMEALKAAYDALRERYDSWYKASLGYEEGSVVWRLDKKMVQISEGALTYDKGWPFMCQYGGTNPISYDMDRWEGDAYTMSRFGPSEAGWTVYVEGSGDTVYGTWDDWISGTVPRHSRYTYLRTAMPEAFDGAIEEAREKIAALNAYRAEFDSALISLQSEWSSYKARFLGLNRAARALGYSYDPFYVPDPGFDRFCQSYGNTEPFLEQLNAYKEKLETAKANWLEDAAALEEDVRQQAALYREQQEVVYAARDRYPLLFQEYRDLLAETQALYFDGSRSRGLAALVSGQKEGEENKGLSDGKRRQEIYAEWGRDLSDRLTRLQALKLEQEELWDDRLTAIGVCREIENNCNIYLMNDLCPEVKLLSPYELERVPLDTGDAALTSADEAVLQDDDARRNVHAARFASLANVQRACREFTGMNELSMAHDEKAVEILSWKPAYLRAAPEEREAMFDRARELLSSVNEENWKLRQQYEYGGWLLDDSANYVYSRFYEWVEGSWAWELANGAYTPVTGLERDAAAEETLPEGAVLDLSAQVRVQPSNASDASLIWESSDVDVCTVDETGRVTAVGCGTAEITARAADSVRTENADGTVTYSPAPVTVPVTVGTGTTPADELWLTNSTWRNYGTEASPRPYYVTTGKDGVRTVTCSVSPVTLDEIHIAVTLTDEDGRMLDAGFAACDDRSVDFRPITLRGSASGTLRLRAFAVNADGAFSPFDGAFAMDETIE